MLICIQCLDFSFYKYFKNLNLTKYYHGFKRNSKPN